MYVHVMYVFVADVCACTCGCAVTCTCVWTSTIRLYSLGVALLRSQAFITSSLGYANMERKGLGDLVMCVTSGRQRIDSL